MSSGVGVPISVGEHAQIELLHETNLPGVQEVVQITVDVPFELASMAEAQLDISEKLLRLIGPLPSAQEVRVPLPKGFALQPDLTSAKYSKKRRQLTVTSPNGESAVGPGKAPADSAPDEVAVPTVASKARGDRAPTYQELMRQALEAPGDGAPDRPSPDVGSSVRRSPDKPFPDSASGCGKASLAKEAASLDQAGQHDVDDDDDDDDDLPPMLDAAHSAPRSVAREAEDSVPPTTASRGGVLTEQNSASQELMRQALEAKERKRLEQERSRREADLGPALKKGFLSNSKGKAKKKPVQEVEEVPYIAGAVDLEAARQDSLRMPEVQAALKGATAKLKEDQSWVTPTLVQAMGTRPDLMKGMSDPRIQEAMQLMQTDPEQAKVKYKDDKEVTHFLKEFSGMMATHFDVLGKESASSASAPAKDVPVQFVGKKTPKGADAQNLPTPIPIEDPKVQDALKDPEVQAMLQQMQSGRSPEFHELCRQNPRLFAKIKVLLDAGLLNMQH